MLISRWRGWSLALMVAVMVGLVGCSSDAGTSTAPTSTPAAAGDQPVTAATVATGLRRIDQAAKEIAQYAGTDKARAARLSSEIESTWKPIEDAIKDNDQTTYLAMEDSFAVLEKAADDGDATRAAQGASTVSSTVQAYLAKYAG